MGLCQSIESDVFQRYFNETVAHWEPKIKENLKKRANTICKQFIAILTAHFNKGFYFSFDPRALFKDITVKINGNDHTEGTTDNYLSETLVHWFTSCYLNTYFKSYCSATPSMVYIEVTVHNKTLLCNVNIIKRQHIYDDLARYGNAPEEPRPCMIKVDSSIIPEFDEIKSNKIVDQWFSVYMKMKIADWKQYMNSSANSCNSTDEIIALVKSAIKKKRPFVIVNSVLFHEYYFRKMLLEKLINYYARTKIEIQYYNFKTNHIWWNDQTMSVSIKFADRYIEDLQRQFITK